MASLAVALVASAVAHYGVEQRADRPAAAAVEALLARVKRLPALTQLPVDASPAESMPACRWLSCWERYPPIVVDTELTIHSLLDVDEVAGTMTVEAALSLEWVDPRLAWNGSITGVKWLELSAQDVWVPSIELTNSAAAPWTDPEAWRALPLWVRCDGRVYLEADVVLRPYCSFDFTNVPYDVQSCTLHFVAPHYGAVDMAFAGSDRYVHRPRALDTEPLALRVAL